MDGQSTAIKGLLLASFRHCIEIYKIENQNSTVNILNVPVLLFTGYRAINFPTKSLASSYNLYRPIFEGFFNGGENGAYLF